TRLRSRSEACLAEARGRQPAFAEGFGVTAFSRSASEGWWGRQDSNLRSHEAADLQSAPFATRDTPPLDGMRVHNSPFGRWTSHRDVKTARLLRRRGRRVYGGSGGAKSTKLIRNFTPDSSEIAIIRNP